MNKHVNLNFWINILFSHISTDISKKLEKHFQQNGKQLTNGILFIHISLQIRFNTGDIELEPSSPADECSVPADYCKRSFYCKRNSENVCESGNLGQCY